MVINCLKKIELQKPIHTGMKNSIGDCLVYCYFCIEEKKPSGYIAKGCHSCNMGGLVCVAVWEMQKTQARKQFIDTMRIDDNLTQDALEYEHFGFNHV